MWHTVKDYLEIKIWNPADTEDMKVHGLLSGYQMVEAEECSMGSHLSVPTALCLLSEFWCSRAWHCKYN